MAEIATGLAAGLATEFIKKLGSMALKKIKPPKELDVYMKKLQKLKLLLEGILRNIGAFKKSTELDGDMIEKLLQGVKDKLDDLLEEGEAIAKRKEAMGNTKLAGLRFFISSPKHLLSPSRFAGEYNAIIQDLEDTKSYLSFADKLAGNRNLGFSLDVVAGPLLTGEVFGRDSNRDDIINLLCHSNGQGSIPVVAIVGIGGQGKTTLAQYVCSDERVKGCFDVVIWVASTPYGRFSDIVGEILNYSKDMKPLSYGMAAIHTQFSDARRPFEGRKMLLVLDNIWYQDNLRDNWKALEHSLKVGGCLGACRSAVLITTRDNTVARIMDTVNPYMLPDLAESDSLLLFQHFAHGQGQEPGVEAVGKEIVAMCPKVPLVTKHIGCQLAQKLTKDDWLAYLKDLASKGALKMENVVIETLKVSYDRLDDNLKSCVAFCSLFPKRVFFTPEMVCYWMALGFIEPKENQGLEVTGEKYVEKLVELNFFQKETNGFCIHDVMYDLITSTCRSKHQWIKYETKEITDGVRHVCVDTKRKADWGILLSKFKGGQLLQSIVKVFPFDYGRLQSRIEELISKFPNLKVLQLPNEGIEKVPKSIGELTSLRHLDLSRNPLRKLPNSITKLVDLLTLDLRGCTNLEELPKDMGNLVKLRHLLVWECNLSHMPQGLGKLRDLQTLDEFVVVQEKSKSSSGSRGKVAAKLEELGHLNNLKRLYIYVGAQSTDIVSQAREAHLEKKTELAYLKVDFKKSAVEDEQFLEALQPNGEKLESLVIMNYGGKRLPTWMTSDRFPNLRRLELRGMPELEVIPGELQDVPSLVGLIIEGFPKLKAIPDWIDSLSSLERLLIKNAPELEVLPDSIASLPSLNWLWLENCPRIESLPNQISHLPKSCRLSVYGCSKALFEKFTKPTGEYWPLIQHLPLVDVKSYDGDHFHH